MKVVFQLAAFLQTFAEGQRTVELEVQGTTVRDALQALFARHPGVRDRVVTETDDVRQHVNVFVGEEAIRFQGGLDAPIAEGKQVTILPAVSGGSLGPEDLSDLA